MNVTFLCGSGGPNYPWEGSHLQKGIGGSEESLIRLAEALAVRGHEVIVYNNCEVPLYHRGVYYFPCCEVECLQDTDVLISWRDWTLARNVNAKVKLHWSHDIPVGKHCPTQEEWETDASNFLDYVVCLNDYHKSIYTAIPENRKVAIPNGITVPYYQVEGIERNPYRALYFSHPNRGLDQLRQCWPKVRERVPQAELAAFWWEPEQFREPVPELGILPMQCLGEREIAIETQKAGVFAYPSCFDPEIAPATCIKAQAGGSIPVTINKGGMAAVLKYFVSSDTLDLFTETLIEELITHRWQDKLREDMRYWSQFTFEWHAIAQQWEELFNTVLQSRQLNAISGRGN